MTEDHSGNKASANLLRRLKSADTGPAWVEFLDLYAPLIMQAASQFEYEQDRVNDCFLYVCEQLNDNDFRRLLKFNAAGKNRVLAECQIAAGPGEITFQTTVVLGD